MSADICPLPFASSPYGTSFAGWEQGGNSPWNMLLPSMGPFHTQLPPRSNPKTGSRMHSRRGCFLTEGLQVFRAQKIAAVAAASKALRKMKQLTSKTVIRKILPPTEEGAVYSGGRSGSCVCGDGWYHAGRALGIFIIFVSVFSREEEKKVLKMALALNSHVLGTQQEESLKI